MKFDPSALQNNARFLRNAAPNQWVEFVSAFGDYVDAITYQIVNAPESEVRVAQGRAQQCAALMRLFTELDKKPSP